MAKKNVYTRPDFPAIKNLKLRGLRVTDTLVVSGVSRFSSVITGSSNAILYGNMHIGGSLTVAGSSPAGGTTVVSHHTTDVSVSPGNILNLKFFAPQAVEIKNIKVYSETQLGSAAGSYYLKVTGSSNSLLATQYDLETLPTATLTGLTLTTTTTNLSMSAGSVVNFAFSSSNSDLTGSGLYLQMLWQAQ